MRLSSLILCAMFLGLGPSAGITVAQNAQGPSATMDAATPNIEGAWEGIINSAVGKLRLVLRVSSGQRSAQGHGRQPRSGRNVLSNPTLQS